MRWCRCVDGPADDGDVGIHRVEQASGAAMEEEVEVGSGQPLRRVGGHRMSVEVGEQGGEGVQVGERPPPPPCHNPVVDLRHDS